MEGFGGLGQMARDRLQPPHAGGAEPLSQPVDERSAALAPVIDGVGAGGELALALLQRLGLRDAKADRLEAEAGIESVDALELERDEPRHMGWIAARQGEADIERRHLAVDPIEAEPQMPRADAIAAER